MTLNTIKNPNFPSVLTEEEAQELDPKRLIKWWKGLLTAIKDHIAKVYDDLYDLKYLEASATWNPGAIADGDMEAKEVTVTGAALGDFAIASFSLDVADLVLDAQVTAANTVTCILANNTGGSVNLASGTLKVRVIK